MSSTLFMNQGTTETPVRDLILEKNGRYVKFADELTEHILQKGSSENTYSLHQTVTVIDYENVSDSVAITSGVGKTIQESIINWNFITFESNDVQDQPELFRKIKPSAIISAADKAGIIPRSKTGEILHMFLIILAGFLAAGMIHLYTSTGSLSPFRLLEVFKDGWSDWKSAGLGVTFAIAGSIILSVTKSYLKTRNPRLHDIIKEHLRASTGAGTHDPTFITAVKNRFLQLPLPMAILIPAPECLDLFSKQVLHEILSEKECSIIGQILWIIGNKGDESTYPVRYSPAENTFPLNKIDYRYKYIDCLPRGKTTSKKPYPRAA
ncbi:MAG: hypothetical protein JW863_09865 [Chitinispirillaceae bacterium]|nr:hypothetical protein [Chitinispirillaceae bacterium]